MTMPFFNAIIGIPKKSFHHIMEWNAIPPGFFDTQFRRKYPQAFCYLLIITDRIKFFKIF